MANVRRRLHRGKKSAGAAVASSSESGQRAVRQPAQQHHPSEADIMRAIYSLYENRLKPFSRILRKRLVEHFEARRGAHAKDCSATWLRSFCEDCPRLQVLPEEGGEWAVLIVDQQTNFVDFHDPTDPYSEDLWLGMDNYFCSIATHQDATLPGGRYGSACELLRRRLPFLAGLSLGEVCHVVELAISQRRILGYANGAIVPYELSTSMMKTECAREQRAISGGSVDSTLVSVNWDTARVKLREILDSAVDRGMETVPLSNIKRLFRSLYGMDLSETMLGYSRLTDLLQDERFADICKVQLQERGYAVLPVRPDDAAGQPSKDAVSNDEVRTPSACIQLNDIRQRFGSFRRGASVPKNFGSHWEQQAACSESRSSDDAVPFRGEENVRAFVCGVDDLTAGDSLQAERIKFCVDEPLCLQDAGFSGSAVTSPVCQLPLATPSPHGTGMRMVLETDTWESTCHALGLDPRHVSKVDEECCGAAAQHDHCERIRFCYNEPLCFDDVNEPLAEKSPKSPFVVLTPSPYYPCKNDHTAGLKACDAIAVHTTSASLDEDYAQASEWYAPMFSHMDFLASNSYWEPWLPTDAFITSALDTTNREPSADVPAQTDTDIPVLRIASYV